uniref:Apolipoprotein L3 n=1 Tax=Catagonus wagneri TaxID=51154 RepID=A0A8C3WD05_9CETA
SGLCRGGSWRAPQRRSCQIWALGHSVVRAFIFPFDSTRLCLGPEGVSGYCRDAQLRTRPAQLRTAGPCPHSARGRLLGEQGRGGPPAARRPILRTTLRTHGCSASELPRREEEADALREYLKELETDLGVKDKEWLDRKRFLKRYPRVKPELEKHLVKLRALADKVDRVHRNCTVSSVVAASTGIVSGILTIIGLSLAPVTAGGAAATVTSVSTSMVDQVNSSSSENEARRLLSTDINRWQVVMKVLLKNTPTIVDNSKILAEAIARISKSIDLCLEVDSKLLMTSRQTSVLSSTQGKAASSGYVLMMSKNARVIGIASAGIGLMGDLYSLVKESIHLHKGAKTELAGVLRQRAQQLEEKLEDLTRIYGILRECPTPLPPEQCRDQGHAKGQGQEVPCLRGKEGVMLRNVTFLELSAAGEELM